MKSPKSYIKFSGTYYFQFFALGVLLPLLSIYLRSIGLSGTQIGTITALGSFIMIFVPPLFGIASDKTRKHKYVLMGLMFLCITSISIISQLRTFPMLIVGFIFFNIGSTCLNPLLDGITLHHKTIPFGKIRLWGAIGFATAAFITGKFVEATSITIIFPLYIVAVLLTMIFLSTIRVDLGTHASLKLEDLKALVTSKVFSTFLLFVFLVAGTLGAHNFFFGLLLKEVGGEESMIGLAFLLFAASEAPFMQIIPNVVRRYGITNVMLAAPVIGAFRWFLHSIIPDPTIHLAIFVLQGLFYAPFLIGVAEYIRTRVPTHLKTSAMTIYSAVGFGLGGICTNFISGLIYDHINAKAIYVFYALLCMAAVLVMLTLRHMDRKLDGHIL